MHTITLTASDLRDPLKERAIRNTLANDPCSDTYEHMAAWEAAGDHLLSCGFYPRSAGDKADHRPDWGWVTFSRELGRTIYARRVSSCDDTVRVDMDAAVVAKLEVNRNRGYRHGGKRI